YRTGMLNLVESGPSHLADAFVEQLSKLGYVQGRNLTIERLFAGGEPSRFPELATELVRRRVEVIVVVGDQAIHAARQATSIIPIVMVACDAVEVGLVTSLARPGANITGVTCISGDLAVKRFELLKTVAPRLSKLAVLYNPGDPHGRLTVNRVSSVAESTGAKVRLLEARRPQDFDPVVLARGAGDADAFFVIEDALTYVNQAKVTDFVTRHRLPAAYAWKEAVEGGGLCSYGPNLADMFRQLAPYVDKILKGAKPADLPVEQPTKYELVINLKTAKALRLTIPQSLLVRADEIIQ